MENRPEDWPSSLSPELLQRLLRAMDQEEFNQFVAALWEEHGWETTIDTDNDAVQASTAAEREPQYAIHTTEYRTTEVDGETVARYSTNHENNKRITPIIVTTGQFSWEAQERASILNAKLIDGEDLINRIESAEAYETTNTYSPIPLSSNTAAELETRLNQQERSFEADPRRNPDIETQPTSPWLTALPGVAPERNWILRFVVLLIAVVTLAPVYNALPTGGSLALRLARIVTYFSVLGSLAGVFISFYMDMKQVQRADTYWNPSPVVYLTLVPFTFGLAWLLYFYKRKYHLGGFLAAPS